MEALNAGIWCGIIVLKLLFYLMKLPFKAIAYIIRSRRQINRGNANG